MIIRINSEINTEDLNLNKSETLELIKDLDLNRGEEDFTFAIINMLIESLMEDDGLKKEYILGNLEFPEFSKPPYSKSKI